MIAPAASTPVSSETVRGELVEALRLDLVGPDNDHPFAQELLPDAPSRWYLTGFLLPTGAPLEQRCDETSTEEIDTAGEPAGLDDGSPPDRAAARRGLLPSSMGLSVLVPAGVETLRATVSWGDYVWETSDRSAEPRGTGESEPGEVQDGEESSQTNGNTPARQAPRGYRRIPRAETITLALPQPGGKPSEFPVPDSRGLSVTVTARAVGAGCIGASGLPPGTRSVSVFLVNNRAADTDRAYRAWAFQASLKLTSPSRSCRARTCAAL